jgi:uncharacterized membrane protein
VFSRWITRIRRSIGRYFVAGVLTFAPIGITIWATAWIIQRLDNLLLPRVLRLLFPSLEEPPNLPLVGAIFTLFVILLFGVVARHLFGREIVRLGERLLSRVPVARNIYAAVKQLLDAIFVSGSQTNFRRVVLIEYPRKGVYALAFTTGPSRGPFGPVGEPDLVNVFVPTTPNPTSGFYLLVPEKDLTPLDITVEQAFKLVMSAGLVAPDNVPPSGAREKAPAEVPATTPEAPPDTPPDTR